METKKNNILTLLLITVIVIIVGIIGYLGFEVVDGNIKQSQSEEITDEFDDLIPTITEEELAEMQVEEGNSNTEDGTNAGTSNGAGTYGSTRRSGSASTGIYNSKYNTWTVGTIRIPATGIKYAIFTDPTPSALEKGVGIVYTANGLNQVGNTVIAGHNYRNRQFFSKNKNLVIGNIIYIKDASGVEVAYEIYNKFTTNESDASFYQRDTGGKREINLTTCTDNGTKTGERIIISAREK